MFKPWPGAALSCSHVLCDLSVHSMETARFEGNRRWPIAAVLAGRWAACAADEWPGPNDQDREEPMSLPVWAQPFLGGVADATLEHALWRAPDGRLVALRLRDGQVQWRSSEPLWLLPPMQN